MKSIPAEHSVNLEITVTEQMTVHFEELGKLHPVYSTYWVAKHFEEAGRKMVLDFLEEGEETIGTQLEVNHTASTLIGMKVTITATFHKQERNRIYASLKAINELGDEIATGTTTQVLLPQQKIEANFQLLRQRWNEKINDQNKVDLTI